MRGVCLNSWQTDGCEWSIGYLWRWMNWLGRLDVVALALMLAYIVIIVSRGSYRYHLARRKKSRFRRQRHYGVPKRWVGGGDHGRCTERQKSCRRNGGRRPNRFCVRTAAIHHCGSD